MIIEIYNLRMDSMESSGKINNRLIIFIMLLLLQNIFYFNVYDIYIVYIVILIQVIIFVTCINKIRIKMTCLEKKYMFLFGILIIISLISSIFSVTFLLSMKRLILVFVPIIMLMGIYSVPHDEIKTFNKLLNIYSGFVTFLSVYGVILILIGTVERIPYGFNYIKIGKIYLGQVVMGHPPLYRISSLTTNPNTLGILVTIGILTLVYLNSNNQINKMRYYIFLFINVVSLFYTQSRAAIISLIIMLLLFYLMNLKFNNINKFKNKFTRKKIFIIGITFIVVIFMLFNSSVVQDRLNSGLNSRSESWIYLIKNIIKNPLIGVGFGTSYENILFENNVFIGAHNFYLSSLSEIGIIGFCIFIFLWISIIVISFKKHKNTMSKEIKNIYAFIISYNTGLAFHQIVENQVLRFTFVMYFIVYTFLFAIVVLYNNKNDGVAY